MIPSGPPPNLQLCWIDLETTGLDPMDDEILEAAMILTVGGKRAYEGSWVIKPEGPLTMDLHVLAMHGKSGLAVELENGVELREVEGAMAKALDDYGFREPQLAGSTVGFDRAFLKVHMPSVFHRLHYRNYDVRTLRTFYQELTGRDPLDPPMNEAAALKAAHRAKLDLEHALEADATVRRHVAMWKRFSEVKEGG